MSETSPNVPRRTPWWRLVLFMLILGLATFAILEQQKEYLLQNAIENAQDDIRFIKFILNDALQQQNFERLNSLVESWGRHVRYTHELKITATNGFVLGHFVRKGQAKRPYQLIETISYSYAEQARLTFTKDLGFVDASLGRLRWQLSIGLILVGLVLWRMVWLSFHRKLEALALDRTNHQLEQTAEQLRTTRAYLQNVFDSMPSTLVGVDADGNISMWNDSAEQMTGDSAEAVLGLPFTEALPDFASQMQDLKETIETGQPTRFVRHVSHSDDNPRFSEIVVYPLEENGSRGAVIRIDDITQRIKMEQMMVQTEKMMTVGGLAAGMAHEINNPLSGVLQSCQNILRRLSPELAVNRNQAQELGLNLDLMNEYLEQRGVLGFLAGIREAGERASRIVADMLAFSRRSTAEFSPISLNDLLDTVVRISASDYDLKKTYDFKKITIVKEYAPDLPSVSCDRTEIEQVLLNLVKNAAHAMAGQEGDNGHSILLRTASDGDYARIEVEDKGPGMDEQTRRRVFEPFFTTKPIGRGTGLGLSVSYYIITEQHKGTISVDSVLGEGTRFVIRLPFSR